MRFGTKSFWGSAAAGFLLLFGAMESEGALKVAKDGSFLADKMSFAPGKSNTVKMTEEKDGGYRYVQTGKNPVIRCQLEPSDRLLLVDGKTVNISQEFPRDKKDFFRNLKAKSISIPLFWGRRLNMNGDMRITLQNQRFYTEYSLGGSYLLEIQPEKKRIAPCAGYPGIGAGIHSGSAGFLFERKAAGSHQKNSGGKFFLSEFLNP